MTGSLLDLRGRTALVTGASSGLGARAAEVIRRAGGAVVVTGRDPRRLRERDGAGGQSALAISGDLRDAGFRAELVDTVAERLGRLDILVNAAGTCDDGPLAEQTFREIADIVELDLLVPIDLCRLAAPMLLASGQASVINIASIFGQISSGGGMAGYHAAKGGLVTVTRHLAEQWGSRGVRVNALAPGFFPTPLTGELSDPVLRDRIRRRTLLRRTPDIAEIDGPLLFLASSAASYVTGHVLTVDGGWTAN